MEEMVQLFRGVTVSRSIFETMKYITEPSPQQYLNIAEQKEGHSETNIGELVVSQIGGYIPPRKRETGKYRWKTNRRPPDNETVKIDLMMIILNMEQPELEDNQLPKGNHSGINDMLNYFGFDSEHDRYDFLRQFSRRPNDPDKKQTYDGVKVLRTLLPIFEPHIPILNKMSPQERKNILTGICSIYLN